LPQLLLVLNLVLHKVFLIALVGDVFFILSAQAIVTQATGCKVMESGCRQSTFGLFSGILGSDQVNI
jgi:hypothetical protein